MKVIDEQEFLYMVSKCGCYQSCSGTILYHLNQFGQGGGRQGTGWLNFFSSHHSGTMDMYPILAMVNFG